MISVLKDTEDDRTKYPSFVFTTVSTHQSQNNNTNIIAHSMIAECNLRFVLQLYFYLGHISLGHYLTISLGMFNHITVF